MKSWLVIVFISQFQKPRVLSPNWVVATCVKNQIISLVFVLEQLTHLVTSEMFHNACKVSWPSRCYGQVCQGGNESRLEGENWKANQENLDQWGPIANRSFVITWPVIVETSIAWYI